MTDTLKDSILVNIYLFGSVNVILKFCLFCFQIISQFFTFINLIFYFFSFRPFFIILASHLNNFKLNFFLLAKHLMSFQVSSLSSHIDYFTNIILSEYNMSNLMPL